MIWWLW